MANAVIDALNRHHVQRKFKLLEFNSAVAALVFRFGNYLLAEIARDVGFLIAFFVAAL